jgi:ring-1,2-phenylacetyl-CoA epoxidase subunit PaaB
MNSDERTTLPSPGEGRDGEGSSTLRPTPSGAAGAETAGATAAAGREWPLWEVFVRSKSGLDHKHCGSLHATDAKMAIQMARDVYTRRQEGTSVWVVRSDHIVASDPGEKASYFDPAEDKVYRHPTFYRLPDAVDHM